MTTQNPKPQPQLPATEQNLLQQVQANVKSQPSWVKDIASTICGFGGWQCRAEEVVVHVCFEGSVR